MLENGYIHQNSRIYKRESLEFVFGRIKKYQLPNIWEEYVNQIFNLSTGNDCQSDREAVLEEQKINYSEFYVPECTSDGRYQTIQCYKSTGKLTV